MKSYKVVLIQMSPEGKDGSRKDVKKSVLCICNEQGTAMVIMHSLKKNSPYNMLLSLNDGSKKNEYMWVLSVE